MADPVVRSEDHGVVRVLVMSRPEVRNALDAAMVGALGDALRRASEPGTVRSVVLAGEGTAFCSGLDLADLAAAAEGPMERHQASARALADLFRSMLLSPLPIVAAVAGAAVAGGAGLVLASDLAVMGPTARIGFTEAKLGFVPALVGVLLARHVGEKGTRELLLGAEPVDAPTALRLGLVNEVHDDPLGRAIERATELNSRAPASLAETKRLLATTRGMALDDALRLAADVNAAARATDALRAGVEAFLARRPPPWSAG